MMNNNLPESSQGTVLVVDDALDTLRMLCDALADEGYVVLVARDGEEALKRLERTQPDAILLDAVMPGLSGFETCRRIKAQVASSSIPVIFMTGLSETSDIVAGFEAGGVDYVVKPVRIEEVLARLATHVRNARVTRLASRAVDVGGMGVLLLDASQHIAWRSPQAERWLRACYPDLDGGAPSTWLHDLAGDASGQELRVAGHPGLVARSLGATGPNEIMVLLYQKAEMGTPTDAPLATESQPSAALSRLEVASLTPRETEVLSWLAKGKTNRDIADILGMSPRTVNKHLEHIFEKLGVETRTAAAALASRAIAA